VELLVPEDSTVTVGQKVAMIELGEAGSGESQSQSKPAASEKPEPKEEPKEAPEPVQKEEPKKQETKPSSQPKEEPKPQSPAAKPAPPPAPQKKPETSSKVDEEKKFALWTRDERRVSWRLYLETQLTVAGQNEPNETEDSREAEAGSEHGGLPDHFPRSRHVVHC
jgi:outer membrane biosynthesis protein TonB